MRVLWICNIVLPHFSDFYNIKKNHFGGWISGMFHELENKPELELGFCFPIMDGARIKNGISHGHTVYSFHAIQDLSEYSEEYVDEFEEIIKDYRPDIIHIWGTEYNHSRSAFEACLNTIGAEHCIIDIQGLVSVIALHYCSGIKDEWINKLNSKGQSLDEEREDFENRGHNENYIIERAKHVSGRTDWDEICVRRINPTIHYLSCHRILRESFYTTEKSWKLDNVDRHSIFLSQGAYSIKGLHYLIRAVKMVKKQYKDVHVCVAGKSPMEPDADGALSPYGEYVKNLLGEMRVESAFEFIGTIGEEEMIDRYVKAHVSVSPSNVENLSNSVCEAMYLGAPVIASYVGGCNTAIAPGVDGILYQHDAEYMLAGYICKVFGDDELANSISKNAVISSHMRHDKNVLGERMFSNYKCVLGVDSGGI